MTRRWFLLGVALLLFRPLGCGTDGTVQTNGAVQTSGTVQTDRTVVIVSWDGGKPSVIQGLVRQGELPTLQALMNEGAYTMKAQTIVPSSTLPSHASMFTGLTFIRHGVSWNTYEPQRGFVRVPTIFDLAKKAGLRTAMVFGKEKLKHLAKPNTLDAAEFVQGNAFKVTEVAMRVLSEQRPHLLFVHFSDPDIAGHGYGWGNEKKGVPPSPEFLAALKSCDEAVGRLVDALKMGGRWQRTLIIVTADHGGHDKGHGSDDPEDVLIPWIAGGGLAARIGKIARTVKTMDTAATALAALGLPVPDDWDGKPIREALGKAVLQNGGKETMGEKTLPVLAEVKFIYQNRRAR